jgi:molecular chaperone DnaK
MGRSVGIDLGTTNSVVSYVLQDRVETIVNTEGSKLTPSVVLFGQEEIIVGELAKRQIVTQAGLVIRSAKRLMGRRFSEVAGSAADFPFQIMEGDGERAEVVLSDGRQIPPELVAAHVLIRMKETAEDFFSEEVDSAVITVPAHFNDAQRTATKKAAELAGLNVLRIINEPTAAALAYGLGRVRESQTVAVFDFGGGTFDISVLHIENDIFEVLATNGDTELGGDNLDEALANHLCDAVTEQTGIDPRGDRASLARIREVAEKVKIELSSLKSTHISLPFIVADQSGPKHYEGEMTREQFNALAEPYFRRLIGPCRQVLSDARLKPEQVSEVLLVGGSTRIPRVQEIVQQFFGKTPNRSVNPDEAVAMGAAIQAGVMRGDLAEVLLLDVTPLSLGIELAGGVFRPLIERNSSIPCEATRKFTTVMDNQRSVMVHVLQGERAKASENRTLAKFRLTGIPPMPKELPEIEVTFRIDADGILEVSAVDLTSGVTAGVQVEGYGALALDSEEIEKLLEEVKRHVQEDEDFLRSAGRRAQAERLSSRMQTVLDEAGDVVTPEDMKRIKETMIRHDLMVAAKDWNIVDGYEEILQEMIEKYEGMGDALRSLGREFDFKSTDDLELPSPYEMEELNEPPPQKQDRKKSGGKEPGQAKSPAPPAPAPPAGSFDLEDGDSNLPPPPGETPYHSPAPAPAPRKPPASAPPFAPKSPRPQLRRGPLSRPTNPIPFPGSYQEDPSGAGAHPMFFDQEGGEGTLPRVSHAPDPAFDDPFPPEEPDSEPPPPPK